MYYMPPPGQRRQGTNWGFWAAVPAGIILLILVGWLLFAPSKTVAMAGEDDYDQLAGLNDPVQGMQTGKETPSAGSLDDDELPFGGSITGTKAKKGSIGAEGEVEAETPGEKGEGGEGEGGARAAEGGEGEGGKGTTEGGEGGLATAEAPAAAEGGLTEAEGPSASSSSTSTEADAPVSAQPPALPGAELGKEAEEEQGTTTALVSQKEEAEEEQALDKKEQKTFEEPGGPTNGTDSFGEVEGGAAQEQGKAPKLAAAVDAVKPEDDPTAPISLLMADSNATYDWELCSAKDGADFVPCLDNVKALKELKAHKRMEHRERHCPVGEDRKRCLVPLPEGYQAPVPWPQSKNEIWFSNVPHPGLTTYKKEQNWVQMKGDKLVFPGGGTQFKHGVRGYIGFLAKILPDLKWGHHVRSLLDIGCGVASFGAGLLPFGVNTLSMAPKDEHEAQIQLALERGLLALLGVLGTQRLPVPSLVFDAVHCARCRVHWHGDGGMLLLEINRILRPGGFFIWSATPVYRDGAEDKRLWEATSDLAKRMCWKLVAKQKEGKDVKDGVGAAIWQKPVDNDCYSKKEKDSQPPMCETQDTPDAAWYVPLKACLHAVPALAGFRAAQWPPEGAARLTHVPGWLKFMGEGLFGSSMLEEVGADRKHWRNVVAFYDKTLGIDWSNVHNVMDMSARYGGFATELAVSKPSTWVLSVVPTKAMDTLPVIYERGLIGIYHDWCESFNTYPRTYDLLHSDHTLSDQQSGCDVADIFVEMDRILRPNGWIIIREEDYYRSIVENLAISLHWELKYSKNTTDEVLLAYQKTFWRPEL